MKQRLKEFDYIRALAALSVIVIHITGRYVGVSRVGYLLNQSVRYAVPIFILLSGLLLYYSNKDKELSYSSFLYKRMGRILIPYIAWTIIYILYNNRTNLGAMLSEPQQFSVSLFKHIIWGTASYHLYFMVIIIQMYLLYPYLKTLLKKNPRAVLIASFFITLTFQTALYLKLLNIIDYPELFIRHYILFPTWLFYFVFGMYFAENIEVLKAKLSANKLFISVIWLASLLILIADSRVTQTFSTSIKPTIMLYCITTFALFYIIMLKLKDYSFKLLMFAEWLSIQSFGLYLCHVLILDNVLYYSETRGLGRLWNGTIGMIFLFLVTTSLSCLFVYAVSLTPFAHILGGVSTKKKYVADGKSHT